MPRRVIRLGLQPSTFSFQDEYGPLVNGLASAAESFMSGGQRRAELEMAREKQAKAEAIAQAELQRQANRDIASDTFRERELGLQEQGVTDRRNAAMRDDVGGLLKGVAGFFKGPSDAAQRLAFDKEQAKLKTEKPAKDVEAERAFIIAKQILGDENSSPEDVAWARQVAGLPAAPPPPLTPEEIAAQNTAETGFPDREDNWYNPADWFRNPPAGGVPAAVPAPASLQDQVGADMGAPMAPQAPAAPVSAGPTLNEGNGFFGPAPTGPSPQKQARKAKIKLLEDAGIPNAKEVYHAAHGAISNWAEATPAQSLTTVIDPNLVDLVRPDWPPEKRALFKQALQKLMVQSHENVSAPPEWLQADRKIKIEKAIAALRED